MINTAAFAELPLGAVRPRGWLHDQLRLQAVGQTGLLDQIWPDVGPASGWLGGSGESWERGPYYLDGLLPLAYVLNDQGLKDKVAPWVEWMLGSQRPDGQFGPAINLDWWPRMVALKVLVQHADATDDPRVVPFLTSYFRYQLAELPARPLEGWGRARGAENVLSVLWLHQRTGEEWLLDLAKLILEQTDDWADFLINNLIDGPAPSFRHLVHGVNVAMGLKRPAMEFLLDADPQHLADLVAMETSLDQKHGLVHGVFSGDEWLGGREPHHGVETCLVTELMFTLEQQARVFGSGRYGDQLELVAYNLLAASNDPRMLAHQYHQQANQVLVSFADRDWSFSGPDANIFGHEPHFGCCTANLHQGWPKLVRSLWMAAGPDTLAAVAYAPCSVEMVIHDQHVRLTVDTAYPFDETIMITVDLESPLEVGLKLRIPQWCTDPALAVAGEAVHVEADADGYVEVRRAWAPGDQLRLDLPMRLRVIDRPRKAVGFRLGPLIMVHGVEEIWREVPDHVGLAEWEISPRRHWNLGVWIDDLGRVEDWVVERQGPGPVPFVATAAPVRVHGRGAPIRSWEVKAGSAGPIPEGPVATGMPLLGMTLLPYGSARMRVAEFPTITTDYGPPDL